MNITALNNITPFTLNNTIVNSTTDMTSSMINNANSTTDGYFGLGMLLIIFIYILIVLMTEQDVFRLDFISALASASGIVLLIGIVMLVVDAITSYQHVMWFAIIFIIALLAKYNQQNG